MPDWNEATTRTELIDPSLAGAGWDLHDPDQVRFEIPVDGTSPEVWQAQQKLWQSVACEASPPYSAQPILRQRYADRMPSNSLLGIR